MKDEDEDDDEDEDKILDRMAFDSLVGGKADGFDDVSAEIKVFGFKEGKGGIRGRQ